MEAEAELLQSLNAAIIREVYDNVHASENFLLDLERALDAGRNVIVIEPKDLGEETARWIAAGNYLQKTAVFTGLGAIFTGLIWSDRPIFYSPLVSLSIICTGVYTISWQFDPCVRYQVDRNKLEEPLKSLCPSMSPVVLVRKNNTKRRVIRCSTITILAALFCACKFFQSNK